MGIFPPSGSGDVDNSGIVHDSQAMGYDGWIVVEQDTLGTHDYAGNMPVKAVGISRRYLREVVGL